MEFSNRCSRRCAYCGLNAHRKDLRRYRMTHEEILAATRLAVRLGYGTVVLQSGEDEGATRDGLGELVRSIKAETPLAVTLSVGECSEADLAAWKQAGADRYLLRFETSDRNLYDRLHPPRRPGERSDRLGLLGTLRKLGYETGSGVLVGLPGQTFESLAEDLQRFAELDLDMIGCGPFIPHPGTALGGEQTTPTPDGQVPATELMGYKVIALARLLCPDANIPSTTALSTLNRTAGRERGLARGANVVMPNLTPARYRNLYEIYPGKPTADVDLHDQDARLRAQIAALGRSVGTGPGASPAYRQRTAAVPTAQGA